METLLQKYANLINSGWRINIENSCIRGDFGLGRRFHSRVTWKVEKNTNGSSGIWKNGNFLPPKKEKFESKEGGFLSAEEALEDMLAIVPDPGKWEPKLEETIIK